MEEEDCHAHKPIVCQIAEHYQENRESMMQSKFKEVSFRADEDMPEETAEMLSKLKNIEHFHLKCNFI
jgi:hypothetical protein